MIGGMPVSKVPIPSLLNPTLWNVQNQVIQTQPLKIRTSNVQTQPNPSAHATAAASFQTAGSDEIISAIESALTAKKAWETLPFADRAAIFLKAADLASTKYRYELMAASMVGQGKNVWQAEIDAAAELCDFLRYSVCP